MKQPIFFIAIACLLTVCVHGSAVGQTARTDAICKISLEERQALAAKNDLDGIYCLAVLYATRYGDERYPDAERARYGANARIYIKRAAALGYRVDSIQRDITGGDNITRTGSYFGRRAPDPRGSQMGCQSNVGVACAAQCGDSGSACYWQCSGSNAWRCR